MKSYWRSVTFLAGCFVIFLVLISNEGAFAKPGNTRSNKNRKKCTLPSLQNGSIDSKVRGMVVFFTCSQNFVIYGNPAAVCVNGNWSHPTPVCAHVGCTALAPIKNGRIVPLVKEAVMKYACNPGYVLDGDAVTYCDGYRWNSTEPPACQPKPLITNQWPCNFESPLQPLCGWMHDPTHDFSWNLRSSVSDLGPRTQPNGDHTFSDITGHFMYIGPSRPWMENDTARLISPVLDKSLAKSSRLPGACVSFWYYMNGVDTGALRVYVMEEAEKFADLEPKFRRTGSQGKTWLHGVVLLENVTGNFQVIMEGVKGKGFDSNVAFDDVAVTSGANCFKQEPTPPPEEELSSCVDRCSPTLNKVAALFVDCFCFPGCSWDEDGDYKCCADYNTTCSSRDVAVRTSTPSPAVIKPRSTSTLRPSSSVPAPTTKNSWATTPRWTWVPTTRSRGTTTPATPAWTTWNYWSSRRSTTPTKPVTSMATTQPTVSGSSTDAEWPELTVTTRIPPQISLPPFKWPSSSPTTPVTTTVTTPSTSTSPSSTTTTTQRTTARSSPPSTSETTTPSTFSTAGAGEGLSSTLSTALPMTPAPISTSTSSVSLSVTSSTQLPAHVINVVTHPDRVDLDAVTSTGPTADHPAGQMEKYLSTKDSPAVGNAGAEQKTAEKAHGMPFWTIVAVCVVGASVGVAILSAVIPAVMRRRRKTGGRRTSNQDEDPDTDVLFTSGSSSNGGRPSGRVRICSFQDSAARFGEEMDLSPAEPETGDEAMAAEEDNPRKPQRRNKMSKLMGLSNSAASGENGGKASNRRKGHNKQEAGNQQGDADNLLDDGDHDEVDAV